VRNRIAKRTKALIIKLSHMRAGVFNDPFLRIDY
jgi:hypothetical protein